MELWIDSIDLDLITEAQQNGKLSGVTTNPAILGKSDIVPEKKLRQLLDIQAGYVAAQTIASDANNMVEQAKRLSGLDKRIIVKIPVNPHGLKAMTALNALGIATMATAVFEPAQVYLAGLAGAKYVAPYLSRIEKISANSLEVLHNMLDIIEIHHFPMKLLAAAITSKEQIVACARAGAHAITLPESAYLALIDPHTLTNNSLSQFDAEWQSGPHVQHSEVFV